MSVMSVVIRTCSVVVIAPLVLAACSLKNDWRETRSVDQKFVVALPGKPTTSTRTIKFNGADVSMTVTAAGAGASLFGVGVARLPAEAVSDLQKTEATMNRFRDAMLSNLNTTVFSEEATPIARTAEGAPTPRAALAIRAHRHPQADAAKVPAGPAQMAAQIFVVEDRLYQVTAHGGEKELTPTVLETFFSSFQLLP